MSNESNIRLSELEEKIIKLEHHIQYTEQKFIEIEHMLDREEEEELIWLIAVNIEYEMKNDMCEFLFGENESYKYSWNMLRSHIRMIDARKVYHRWFNIVDVSEIDVLLKALDRMKKNLSTYAHRKVQYEIDIQTAHAVVEDFFSDDSDDLVKELVHCCLVNLQNKRIDTGDDDEVIKDLRHLRNYF